MEGILPHKAGTEAAFKLGRGGRSGTLQEVSSGQPARCTETKRQRLREGACPEGWGRSGIAI